VAYIDTTSNIFKDRKPIIIL